MRALLFAALAYEASAASCCWSKWGDASTCGNYPAGGSGAICGNDGITKCSSDSDCHTPAPVPAPVPTPVPLPVPTPVPPTPVPGTAWAHNFTNLMSMMWADYNSPNLLTDDEAQWLATHYAILSLEKCTGKKDGFLTEDAIYKTAAQLKRFNANLKVLMYWGACNQHTVDCYHAGLGLEENHSDFYLLDGDGQRVPSRNDAGRSGWYALDYRKDEVRKWWTSVPLSSPLAPDNVTKLIDGILADGVGESHVPKANLAESVKADWLAGQYKLLDEMQAVFTAANGGIVAGNGISMYPNDLDHNMGALAHMAGAIAEHFAAFESRDMATGALNKTRVAEELALIADAAARGKVVLVNMWPGPVVGAHEWAGQATPTTNKGRAEALLRYWAFAMAAFLTMAEPTVYFQYVWWYPVGMGVMPCVNQSSSVECWGSPDWYEGHHIYQPVGQPTGPAQRSPDGVFRWERRFEHADVVLDLDDPDQSSVTWHQQESLVQLV